MINTFHNFMAAAVLVLLPSLSAAQAYFTDSGHAEFTSRVPLHKFTGESDKLVGRVNLADSTIDFYIDLTTLETGIEKRDKDMRRSLETDDYPFAEFFGKLVSELDLNRQTAQPATVRGVFEIHGVSREIDITGSITPTPGGLRIEANWELRLTDYDIEPPSLLIVKVDEVQEIRIDATLPAE